MMCFHIICIAYMYRRIICLRDGWIGWSHSDSCDMAHTWHTYGKGAYHVVEGCMDLVDTKRYVVNHLTSLLTCDIGLFCHEIHNMFEGWMDLVHQTHGNILQHASPRCNTLQHTATHGNTRQHTATHGNTLHHTATRCITLQHASTCLTNYNTHCNIPQHTATYCDTLQHTATRKRGVSYVRGMDGSRPSHSRGGNTLCHGV